MRYAIAAGVLLGLAWSTAFSAKEPEPPVQAQLLADTAAVQPGKPFTVGVLLRIAPDWHVYWINPGDSGVPTTVKFLLPAGFVAGPLQFPVPIRFEQPGEIAGFGYEESVLLISRVTPPEDLPLDKPVRLQARVSWLGCRDVCIPGKDLLALELPVARAARSANSAMFATWKAQLPVEAGGDASPADVEVEGAIPAGAQAGRFEIRIDWKRTPSEVEWFPGPNAALRISDLQVQTTGNRTRITFEAGILSGQTLSATTLESVVGYAGPQGARHGISIPVHLRAAGHPD